MRLTLFVTGIVITIVGWLFDRATQFTWLLKVIAPDYLFGVAVLDALVANEKVAVIIKHPGAGVLLARWPGLSDRSRVESIGRSVAFMQFGHQIKNDFEIIAFDDKNREIGKRWTESDARKVLAELRDKRLFRIGAAVFVVGLVVTFSTGLLEFVEK